MNRLIAHASEEHVKDPSTLSHHWPAIVGLTLVVAAVGYVIYQLLREKPAKSKDDV